MLKLNKLLHRALLYSALFLPMLLIAISTYGQDLKLKQAVNQPMPDEKVGEIQKPTDFQTYNALVDQKFDEAIEDLEVDADDEVFYNEDGDGLRRFTITIGGETRVVTVVSPPQLPKKDSGTIGWIGYIMAWIESLEGYILIVFGVIDLILRAIPTKRDVNLLRIVSSWIDKLGDIGGLFALFKNRRATPAGEESGIHTSYPDEETTPSVAAHVTEYYINEKGQKVIINGTASKAKKA